MKKVQVVGIIAGVLFLIVSCFSTNDKDKSAQQNINQIEEAAGESPDSLENNITDDNGDLVEEAPTPLTEEEVKERVANSKKAVEFLFSLSAADDTENELMRSLRALNLDPELGSDKNEDTGEMLMIRSKAQIPGVRYFHAQYFSKDEGGFIPQHMSFEMPPTPNNFQTAIDIVKEQFEITEKPKYKKKDYIHWELEGGKTVYITVLSKLLMEDNPWNAYDYEKDKGTVSVTVEMDPHHGMEKDEGHFDHEDH